MKDDPKLLADVGWITLSAPRENLPWVLSDNARQAGHFSLMDHESQRESLGKTIPYERDPGWASRTYMPLNRIHFVHPAGCPRFRSASAGPGTYNEPRIGGFQVLIRRIPIVVLSRLRGQLAAARPPNRALPALTCQSEYAFAHGLMTVSSMPDYAFLSAGRV